VWSDASGSWLRRLSGAGHATSPPVRVTERCEGGLAIAETESGLVMGCMRPSAEGGEARLLQLDQDGRPRSEVVLGPVGRDGHGVALARADGGVWAAYHEGTVGQHSVHVARVRDGRLVEDTRISHAERPGASPALIAAPQGYVAAWSETSWDGSTARSQVWVMRAGQAAKKLAESAVLDAAPSLTQDGANLLLSFRNRRAQDKRSELYVMRLDAHLEPLAAPARVGRANSEGAPEVRACGGLRVAVLPREYGDEYYVALHALDENLRNLGGGHQYYANSREFVLADAACSQEGLTLLIGERAPPSRPGVEMLSLRFSCH
jgi:hypothetical protein